MRHIKNSLYLYTAISVIGLVSRGYSKGYNLILDRKSSYPAAKVFLKNGSVLIDNCREFYKPKHKQREIIVKGRKIKPYETDSIIVNFLVGVPHDSTWLFKILNGPATAYSPLPILGYREYTHIQKDHAAIEEYSDVKLKEFLKGYYNDKSEFDPQEAITKYNSDPANRSPNSEKIDNEIVTYNNAQESESTTGLFRMSQTKDNVTTSFSMLTFLSSLSLFKKRTYLAMRVYMKSGEAITDYFQFKHGYDRWIQYWIDNKQKKIMPSETDSIFVNFLTGIPYDSTWLFKIIDGKISAFMPLPMPRVKKFTHIQKEGSSIKKYSHKLLKKYLTDNIKAHSVFHQLDTIKGRTFTYYNPRDAILEYNFGKTSKKEQTDSLLLAVEGEKSAERKITLCKQIIAVDSTIFKPYLILGDIALEKGNSDEAYQLYTAYLRYSTHNKSIERVRRKIEIMKKPVLY